MGSLMINEQRFFSDVLPYIGNKNKIIEELIENAVRSKSRNVSITLDGDTVTCINDGAVLGDFRSLLTVASTDYDEDVLLSQRPAGMGILMMLSASEVASFVSGDKTLSVVSKRFFSDSSYRTAILEFFENQSILVDKTRDVFDGFKTVLKCSKEFVKSLRDGCFNDCGSGDMSYRFSSRYCYYNINICINGIMVERQEHEWLVHNKGEGKFKGCEIGITGNSYDHGLNYRNGTIYWFGKEIQCPEISPFTIVVNESTDLVMPNLPDRVTISNGKDELSAIKRELELMFFDDINKVIRSNCRATNDLLSELRKNYNVEHFTHWKGDLINGYDIFYTDDCEIELNGEVKSMDFAPNWIGVCCKTTNNIGGTKAPKSLLGKLVNKIDVVVDYIDDGCTQHAGNSEVELVNSITVNGNSVDWVLDEDDWVVLFVPNIDTGAMAEYLRDKDMDCEHEVSEWEYQNDLDVIVNLHTGVIDLDGFKNSLTSLLPLNIEQLKGMRVWFGDGVIDVELANGKTHQLKVA